MGMALLVVDVQTAMIEAEPYNRAGFLANIRRLSALAVAKAVPVFYVQHDGGPGDELERGGRGWQLCEDMSPAPGATIVEKKRNSAFYGTTLHGQLQAAGIGTIILAGMQTEYCIDATCKSAFDLRYTVRIPASCTTTYGNEYLSGDDMVAFYEKKIWHGRYAEVIGLETAFSPSACGRGKAELR